MNSLADPNDAAIADGALAGLLPRFAACRVLVLGDVMLDRYVFGDVRRISPEAPIPVLKAEARRTVLGGAANVAQNVAALGAGALLVGVVGMDEAASEIGRLLAAAPAIAASLVPAPGRPTTVKTRFIAGGHQLLRLDEETSFAIEAAIEDRVLAAFAQALGRAEVVVLSDYAKGVLTDRVLAGAIAAARAAGKPVIADPKRGSFAAYRGVDVLTPNEAEAAQASRDRHRRRRWRGARGRTGAGAGGGGGGAGDPLGEGADAGAPRRAAAARADARAGSGRRVGRGRHAGGGVRDRAGERRRPAARGDAGQRRGRHLGRQARHGDGGTRGTGGGAAPARAAGAR